MIIPISMIKYTFSKNGFAQVTSFLAMTAKILTKRRLREEDHRSDLGRSHKNNLFLAIGINVFYRHFLLSILSIFLLNNAMAVPPDLDINNNNHIAKKETPELEYSEILGGVIPILSNEPHPAMNATLLDLAPDTLRKIAAILIMCTPRDKEAVVALYSTCKTLKEILREQFFFAQSSRMRIAYLELKEKIPNQRRNTIPSILTKLEMPNTKDNTQTWEEFYNEHNINLYEQVQKLSTETFLINFEMEIKPCENEFKLASSCVDHVLNWLNPKSEKSWVQKIAILFTECFDEGRPEESKRFSNREVMNALMFVLSETSRSIGLFGDFIGASRTYDALAPVHLPSDIKPEYRKLAFTSARRASKSVWTDATPNKYIDAYFIKLKALDLSPEEITEVTLAINMDFTDCFLYLYNQYNFIESKGRFLKHLIQARHVAQATKMLGETCPSIWYRKSLYNTLIESKPLVSFEGNLPNQDEIMQLAKDMTKKG